MGVPRRTIKSSVAAGSVDRARVREVMLSLKNPDGPARAQMPAANSSLVDAVAARATISAESARKAVDALFSATGGIIPEALRKGETVSMTGFGSFHAAGGAALAASASDDVVFLPDESLTERLEA